MSEENSPSPAENDDASKAETIRITLPPKQEQPVAKRETVRINLPGRPVPPTGVSPKKETTKLSTGTLPGGLPAAPSAPSAPGLPKAPSAPSMPPPPRPPSPPSAPGAPSAPSAPGLSKPGIPAPPRPIAPPSAPAAPGAPAKPAGVTPPKPPGAPGAGAQPTVPLRPAPAAGGVAGKAAAPKKETARITLPPEGTAKPALPKATLKMGQTQPLAQRPAASSSTSTPAVTKSPATIVSAPETSGAVDKLSIFALILSAVALGVVVMIRQAVQI